jgi:hypothetical protein
MRGELPEKDAARKLPANKHEINLDIKERDRERMNRAQVATRKPKNKQSNDSK